MSLNREIMANELGLNEFHHNILTSYVRFANYQKERSLKTLKESFDNFKLSKVMEDTFTSEEVQVIIDDMSCLIIEDVKSDIMNAMHTVILLLCQLCSQAEQWYLNLQTDTSELENKEMLEKVEQFYKNICSSNYEMKASDSSLNFFSKLKPLCVSDDSAPLNLTLTEINRVKEENEKLCARLKDVQNKAIEIIEEKSAISKALEEAHEELSSLRTKQVEIIEQKMSNFEEMKNELEAEVEEKIAMQKNLQKTLEETKQRLAQAEEQCQMTVKELEHKFSETTAYQNMKQILAAKNEQIKNLRRTLNNLKPNDESNNEDEDEDEV